MPVSGCSALHGANPNLKKNLFAKINPCKFFLPEFTVLQVSYEFENSTSLGKLYLLPKIHKTFLM